MCLQALNKDELFLRKKIMGTSFGATEWSHHSSFLLSEERQEMPSLETQKKKKNPKKRSLLSPVIRCFSFSSNIIIDLFKCLMLSGWQRSLLSTFWLNLKNIQVKSIQIKWAFKKFSEISQGPGVAEIKKKKKKNHRKPKIGKH